MGVLVVQVDRPVVVRVDGTIVDYADASPFAAEVEVRGGRHQVAIERVTGIDLWHGTVEVPEAWRVSCGYRAGAFACTSEEWLQGRHITTATGERVYPAPPAYGVVVDVLPPANPAPPLLPPAPPPPPPKPVPTSVDLVVRALDRQWMVVKVDGAAVIDLKNAGEGRATFKPGVHTIEFFEFMADTPYARVRVDTGTQATITVGAREKAVPECYDCADGVWTVQR